MKRILSVAMCVILLLSVCIFASCGKNEGTYNAVTESDTTAELTEHASEKGIPVVAFTADKTEAVPGEEITVTFRMSDAEWLACFSTELKYDPQSFSVKDHKAYTSDGFYDMFSDEDGTISYYGYVLETIDIDDADILSVTFTVSEDAEPGTEASIVLGIPEMKLGTDKGGAETYEVCESYGSFAVSVKIV